MEVCLVVRGVLHPHTVCVRVRARATPVILAAVLFGVVWAITEKECLPGGNLFGITVLFICAVTAGKLVGLIRLPGLPPFPPLLGKTQGAGLREFRTSGSQPPVRRPVMAWCSRDPPTNKYVFISETYFSRLLLLLEELVSGWDQDGTVLN